MTEEKQVTLFYNLKQLVNIYSWDVAMVFATYTPATSSKKPQDLVKQP